MREPSTPFHKAATGKTAFTLIELLVAVSVLILLLVMVTQLINSATLVTVQSNKRVDSDTQARMLFDRMSTDFAKISQRPDLDAYVEKNVGNDRFFFFSEAQAYYDTSFFDSTNKTQMAKKNTLALIGYRVPVTSDTANFSSAYSLERFGKGLTWEGTPGTSGTAPGGICFAIVSSSNTIAQNWATDLAYVGTTGTNNYYHVLTNQVFRMEICFLVKDTTSASGLAYCNYPVATKAGTPPTGSSAPGSPLPGDRWYDTTNKRACIYNNGAWQPNGLKDVQSVIVTIAILDSATRKNLAMNTDLSALVALFPDSTDQNLIATPPLLPAQAWKKALETALTTNAASFRTSYGIPKSAGSQIRIYQRYFPLNTISK